MTIPWDFPGKTTGVDSYFLLQGIFPTHTSNPCLLCLMYWQADSLPQHLLGSTGVVWRTKYCTSHHEIQPGWVHTLLWFYALIWACCCCCCWIVAVVSDFVWPPRTAAHQAPLSLGFSRQEYWNGLPFPAPMHNQPQTHVTSKINSSYIYCLINCLEVTTWLLLSSK